MPRAVKEKNLVRKWICRETSYLNHNIVQQWPHGMPNSSHPPSTTVTKLQLNTEAILLKRQADMTVTVTVP
jgi:hypothetical protein